MAPQAGAQIGRRQPPGGDPPNAAACQTGGMALGVVGDYLAALLRSFVSAIAGRPETLAAAGRFGWAVPVGIAVVGGISLMIGQSMVLAINRVTRLRACLTLLSAGLGMPLLAGLEAAMAGTVGRLLIGEVPRAAVILPSVLVSYAPYWFGLLVLLPYSGPGLARLLHVWHFAVLWASLIPLLQAGPTTAMLVAAAAWLLTILIDWLVEHSSLRLRERLFRLVSGTPGLTSSDLMRAAGLRVGP